MPGVTQVRARPTAPTTTAIEAAWPRVIGPKARSTVARRCSCRPSATAKSQPIPGLRPWKAPSRIRVSHGVALVILLTPVVRRPTGRWATARVLELFALVAVLAARARGRPANRQLARVRVAVRVGRGVAPL